MPRFRVPVRIAGATSAPSDASLEAEEVSFYLDPTAASPKVMAKGKDSAGTVFNRDLGLDLSTLTEATSFDDDDDFLVLQDGVYKKIPGSLLNSGQRVGGFIGDSTAIAQATTQNQAVDIPGAVMNFTKGARPIKIMVYIEAVYLSVTNRVPTIEIRKTSDSSVIFAWPFNVFGAANTPIPVNFSVEPEAQPSTGSHEWKLTIHNANASTPGTMTVASGTLINLCVYNC